ncbi:MAG: HupB [Pseudobdellovibrio sp.]|jgi:hypothetical protein|nr:HupB [Pseudobdellovibrio sp.]
MPQGSKESYSTKQKRMARHIEDSEKKSGKSTKSAERIAWATVNKQTGGAKKKSASGSKKKAGGKTSSSKRSGKKSSSRRTTH